MEIVSVLDWEWSRAVPRQLSKPPLWLRIPNTTLLAWDFIHNDSLNSFEELRTIARIRECEKYGNELLSDKWAKRKKDGGFRIANALESWTDINWKSHPEKIDLNECVRAFMEEDPAHRTLIVRKLREGIAYKAEVGRLENTCSPSDYKDKCIEATSGCKDKPASAHAIVEQCFSYHLWRNIILLLLRLS